MESLHPSAHPITWSRLLVNWDLRYLSASEWTVAGWDLGWGDRAGFGGGGVRLPALSKYGLWGIHIGGGVWGGSPASSLSMGIYTGMALVSKYGGNIWNIFSDP